LPHFPTPEVPPWNWPSQSHWPRLDEQAARPSTRPWGVSFTTLLFELASLVDLQAPRLTQLLASLIRPCIHLGSTAQHACMCGITQCSCCNAVFVPNRKRIPIDTSKRTFNRILLCN
jgi:hypothetical protein